MEKEGLKRSLALLEARNVTLDSIVTDCHPQIQKFLREAKITHYYDVWHMEKGIFPQCFHGKERKCQAMKRPVPILKVCVGQLQACNTIFAYPTHYFLLLLLFSLSLSLTGVVFSL